MSDKRKKIEEQVLDVFLVETLGKVEPPDLKSRILTRLAKPESHGQLGPSVQAAPRTKPTAAPSVPTRSINWKVAVTAAVAASILLAVWLRSDRAPDDPPIVAANPAQEVPDALAAVDPDRGVDRPQQLSPPQPPRGIPLVMDSSDATPREDQPASGSSEPSIQEPAEAVTLVSKQFDSELMGYWKAIGIEPAEEADADEIVTRLVSILGVKLPAEAVSDPETLQTQFARNQVAREIAFRWLQQMTDRGLQRLDQESRDQLTNELAVCIQGKQSFDRTVAGWIDGQSPRSSSFYGAISHTGRDSMARRLAALSMNVDLRCIRCHDSTIEGSGQQKDYWGFIALLSRGVSRDAEGHVTIDPEPDKSKSLFYELPDGRQRLAEPFVSEQWIESPSSSPAVTIKAWAAQLVGSERSHEESSTHFGKWCMASP